MNEILTPQQIEEEAKTAYETGKYSEAAQLFVVAQKSYILVDDELMAAEMANNSSVAYLMAGDNKAALAVLNGLEYVFIEANDRKRHAISLGNRASALEALGHLDEAEATYWKAAEIFKELGEIELRLPIMQSISKIQLRTGRHLQAVASMYAGVEKIKKPNLKQKFLKRLLRIPIQILDKQSIELLDEPNNNP